MAIETLRPNAAGDETNLNSNDGDNYTLVDEASPDEEATYVYTTSTKLRDLYHLDNHVSASGTINHITVYARCEVSAGSGNAYIAIKSGTTVDEDSAQALTSSWVNYSHQWTTNPDTGNPWQESELDSLQAGIAMDQSGPGEARCTQVYIEVDYAAVTEKSSSDTGSGAEAKATGNPVATLTKTETGTGADVLSQAQAILDAAETGSGLDAYVSLQTPAAKSSSDAGSGVEGTPMQAAILAGTESGSGVEAFVARLLAALDTGYGVEAGSVETDGLLKNLFATELGQGSDCLIAKIEMPTKGGGMKLWT